MRFVGARVWDAMVRAPALSSEVRAALLAVLVARTAVNGAHRIVYPFLPEIARGLGVSLGVMGGLLALRSTAGLAAPLVPRLAESLGRRTLMLVAVAGTVLGCLLLASASGVAMAAAGLLTAGLAKPLFDIPCRAGSVPACPTPAEAACSASPS